MDNQSLDIPSSRSQDNSAEQSAPDIESDASTLERRVSIANLEEQSKRELRRIATAVSQDRRNDTVTTHLGLSVPDDPALDPLSDSFELSKWLRTFTQAMEADGIQLKRVGVAYKDLEVSGTGNAMQLQQTVVSILQAPFRIGEHFRFRKEPKRILRGFDGLLNSGELLVVLGRPGAGCSTFLRAITGQLENLEIGKKSTISYNGISQQQMVREFKGEMTYNQEVDKHFPHLTVCQTLEFAAAVRTPSRRVGGVSRATHIKHATQVAMSVCGLSHTYDTKVGNEFIRGVSGGERKRVSIAEMMLAGSPLSAWDNSTRGLDSATALQFVKSLRIAADLGGSASAVAIYQASQAIYNLFDKATVLYEGRQIYFGPASLAKEYFERMGWLCPARQTTGDFLTSITNPRERQARPGMENQVPRTPDDFYQYWRNSAEYQALRNEIGNYEQEMHSTQQGRALQGLRHQKQQSQARHVRPKSPYMISIAMQVKLTTWRAYQRIWNDISATATQAGMNFILALIMGSVFYGTTNGTAGFYAKGSVLFQAILLNGLSAIAEINSQYAQRPIVEKHASYAFYHPATEAVASIMADIPIKFIVAVFFNTVLYFMSGLQRTASQFFLYFLVSYIATFTMSAIFRTLAAVTKTISQAMTLAGVMILALVIYTGFVIPIPQMHPWFGWIRWINPIFYAFEILIANEFHGHRFPCSSIVPPYSPLVGDSWICSTVGAVPGEFTVSGDAYIAANYEYHFSHVWRNFGIILVFLFVFMLVFFAATELNSATGSTAEFLVFQRGRVPDYLKKGDGEACITDVFTHSSNPGEEEKSKIDPGAIVTHKDVFSWSDVNYDIEIKGKSRRLLDHVSGWVKPGTLTALMGVSGAGKTTLLDALAQRTKIGIITGDMLVNGKPLDADFQRQIGYVQQQDLHLATATVRESLRFSAQLRQPKSTSDTEKRQYVEEVIDLLGMREFADAVVGIPGEGLNVEQRKLLTIGVELVAKPKLLLFLDEPTSGLDSQSSWAICVFLRKLAHSGQAVLCTVHQPSAILFQQFDRLLLLAAGGKTVYFGDIGPNSRTMLDYFESNGAPRCSDQDNPAEYMLEVVNSAGPNNTDWHEVWKASQQFGDVVRELEQMQAEKGAEPSAQDPASSHDEFAMPFNAQLITVTIRVFQQYWRMPNYIYAKFMLGITTGLFIGFSFWKTDGSLAGMQNVLFAIFMVITIFSTIVQQIQPNFISQRSLYEVRERPSKVYSWKAFMVANIIVEIPYQIITGVLIYACFYYPVMGFQSSAQQGLVLLFTVQLLLYASSFAAMTIAALPDAQTASAIVTLLVLMSLTFCGVLQSPTALPGFWTFMYHVSPFTYWVAGMASTQMHARPVQCSAAETNTFNPPSGQNCGEYLSAFLSQAPGSLQNPEATENCRYCSLRVADQYLAGSNIYYTDRWRNFGIVWAYVMFNISVAVLSYWALRVKKWSSLKRPK